MKVFTIILWFFAVPLALLSLIVIVALRIAELVRIL